MRGGRGVAERQVRGSEKGKEGRQERGREMGGGGETGERKGETGRGG